MTEQPHRDKPEEFDPYASPFEINRSWYRNRREKIVQEVLANRRGEYTVPTWVLVVALVGMIAAIYFVLLVS